MATFKVGDKAVCVNMIRPDCLLLNGVVVEVIQGLHRESWGDVEGVHWCYRIRIPSGLFLEREGIIMPGKMRPLLKPKPRQRNRRRAKPRGPEPELV